MQKKNLKTLFFPHENCLHNGECILDISLQSLVSKLNPTCKSSLEAAAGLCLSNMHYEVEIEHMLIKILEQQQTDIHIIFKHFEIDTSKVQKNLVRALDNFRSGNSRTPVFSPHLPKIFEKSWTGASLNYKAQQIRSGHLLLTLLTNGEMRRLLLKSVNELEAISCEELEENFLEITGNSPESDDEYHSESANNLSQNTQKKISGKTPNLDQYTINLTNKAKSGEIDRILGRDEEIRQMVDILTRRRQNNPILTGEAGVGKTAVVEGLALRISEGDVPPILENVALHTLDMGLLQAGASVKGEFENRLKSVIEEVKASPHPIILFIDEAHTMIGAGGQEGQSDAANLLKPALARGDLRTIAATTWSEYKKYFEKDAALARRFQVVKIEEPDTQKGINMLRAISAPMEKHHNVRILDEAIVEAVTLSERFIIGRQLPDKAVSVLDTACARVGISQSATPAIIEDLDRHIYMLETEKRILKREEDEGLSHSKRLKDIDKDLEKSRKEKAKLEEQLTKEKEVIEKIKKQRSSDKENDQKDSKKIRHHLFKDLEKIQGKNPMIHIEVTAQTIAEVISGWTGIPMGKMLSDEIKTVMKLEDILKERVIGQDHALKGIAQRIQTSRANLDDPNRPIGVFMLVGPSGVGKTETALALSDILYGGDRNMITINMSEYQEAHTVSGLKGSPPGYVGFGEGGVLTEAVRRNPYSVVLLDEIEKAHPDVIELFYQVFDKGTLEDGEGRIIDFKNTVIILTSNVATETVMKICEWGAKRVDPSEIVAAIWEQLKDAFKPAFLGRLVTIPYYPIADKILEKIVKLKLNKIVDRVLQNHKAQLIYDDKLIKTIAKRCTEVDSGARNIDMILTGNLLPAISESVLTHMAKGKAIKKIEISVNKQEDFDYKIF